MIVRLPLLRGAREKNTLLARLTFPRTRRHKTLEAKKCWEAVTVLRCTFLFVFAESTQATVGTRLDAYYDRGAPLFFSEVPQYGLSQKLIWSKIKLLLVHGVKNPVEYVCNENRAKIIPGMAYFFFFRRFWVWEPRHSQNIFAKKRYTSIVATGLDAPRFSKTRVHGMGDANTSIFTLTTGFSPLAQVTVARAASDSSAARVTKKIFRQFFAWRSVADHHSIVD